MENSRKSAIVGKQKIVENWRQSQSIGREIPCEVVTIYAIFKRQNQPFLRYLQKTHFFRFGILVHYIFTFSAIIFSHPKFCLLEKSILFVISKFEKKYAYAEIYSFFPCVHISAFLLAFAIIRFAFNLSCSIQGSCFCNSSSIWIVRCFNLFSLF